MTRVCQCIYQYDSLDEREIAYAKDDVSEFRFRPVKLTHKVA
jgi:hypothetical protein